MAKASSGGKVSSIIAALFLLVFIGIWGSLIGNFDYMAIHAIRQQSVAQAFPTVPGRVVESRVSVYRGRRSITYTPVIRYTYRVNGQMYKSGVLRHGMWGGGNQGSAQRAVRAHPVGSPVLVHYNPADPSDALLEPGVRGGDWLMLLFFLPFNLIPLWMFLYLIRGGLRGNIVAEAGGAKIVYWGVNQAVRLPKTAAAVVALVVGILSWIIAIVVAFVSGGSDPPVSSAIAAWLVAVVPPIVAFLLARLRAAGGRYDLVIDSVRRTLTLPMTFGRTMPIELSSASVQDIHIQEIITRTSKGGTQRRYELSLVHRGPHGNEQRELLARWGSQRNAEALAEWIREKAGLKAQTSEDSKWT